MCNDLASQAIPSRLDRHAFDVQQFEVIEIGVSDYYSDYGTTENHPEVTESRVRGACA